MSVVILHQEQQTTCKRKGEKKMFEVYVCELGQRRLVATFEDRYDATEYAQWIEAKCNDDRRFIVREK
jgi:hypothetical protein